MNAARWSGAVAIALALVGGRTVLAQDSRALPTTIGDLNAIQLVEILDPKGEVLLHGTLKTTSTKPNEIERKAELVSPTGQKAEGEVEIEIEHKKSGTKSEVEVEVEHLPINTQCELRLDGRAASTFLTTKGGKAKFELKREEK